MSFGRAIFLFDRFSWLLARVSIWLVVVLAVVMVASQLLGVLFRYVFQAPLSWSYEISLLAFVWIVFIAASVGVREGFHARLSFVDDLLPQWGRHLIQCLVLLMIASFGILMISSGWDLTKLMGRAYSAAIRYPEWLRTGVIPLSGSLIVIHAVARLIDGETDKFVSRRTE